MKTDPVTQLERLFRQACSLGDPCARYASFITIDEDGLPASRIVTLLSLDAAGIAVSVNAASPKIRQWQANGKWELAGFWPAQMVQYRLRGQAMLEQNEQLRRDWQAKRRASRLADRYHQRIRQQSSPLPSRAALLAEMAQLEREPDVVSDAPPNIALLRLQIDMLELWTGSLADRLHDRRLYRKVADGWSETVLVP
ncbi:pyridoxamine 5'-phosphate oxidase family protein [Chromobacterium subtsugae]|uniref:pyridoxamine 5'-phosphate oxidase family protein n=1 Tax=Chromobacterium subtsugae TaxID=251747 RepID=UPI00069B1A71|nr:pyridoxamine 5'-phosphate oxidase family protein [Chromobacterium subtsugae]